MSGFFFVVELELSSKSSVVSETRLELGSKKTTKAEHIHVYLIHFRFHVDASSALCSVSSILS